MHNNSIRRSLIKAFVPIPLVSALLGVLVALLFWQLDASETALEIRGLTREEYHLAKVTRWQTIWRAIVVLSIGAVATWNVRFGELTDTHELEGTAPARHAHLLRCRIIISLAVLLLPDLFLWRALANIPYVDAFAIVAHTVVLQFVALSLGSAFALVLPWPSLVAPLLLLLAALWDTILHYAPHPLRSLPLTTLPPAGCLLERSNCGFPLYTNFALLIIIGASALVGALYAPIGKWRGTASLD
jgi:hypothetical protein